MESRHYLSFNIAGFTYWDGIDVFEELKIGTTLTLEADPSNRYDANAVKILYKDVLLGYIPRDVNKDIFKFLCLGHHNLFEARINRISPDSHTEQQIGVVVRIVDATRVYG